MGITPTVPVVTIPINKEDLFFVLLRLIQMLNDADPFSDIPEEVLSDIVNEGDDDGELVIEEGPTEDDADISAEEEVLPPTYFRELYAAQDDFTIAVCNEYIGLFALLSTPLNAHPKLKKEFIAYAHEHGEDIEFTSEKVEPKRPKLSIVPPPKTNPDDKDNPPPKK